MTAKKRKALEAAGWRFGDAADFLGMTDQERQLLDIRIEAALAVCQRREAQKLTQKQLAARLKTSQPRIAKIERAAADVSLEQMFRAFLAMGGRCEVKRSGGGGVGKTKLPSKSKGARSARGKAASAIRIGLIGA